MLVGTMMSARAVTAATMTTTVLANNGMVVPAVMGITVMAVAAKYLEDNVDRWIASTRYGANIISIRPRDQ